MTYKFGAGGSPVSVTSGSTYQMQATDTFIRINKTSGSATAITLAQTPVNYQPVTIKDDKGDAGTNNITITPYSGTIDGATNVILQGNDASVTLEYNGTEWNVIASTGSNTSSSTVDINGGTIDGTVIGASTPAAGTFTTIAGSLISTGSTTSRALANRFAEVVNVKDFGAVGDDSADDTAAINAAIAYCRTNKKYRLVFPPATYKTTGPLNFTGFGSDNDYTTNMVIDGWGAMIDCHMSGSTAAIDMMGSRWMTFNGLNVKGDSTSVPNFGLQMGRISSDLSQAADQHYFNHLRFIGKFAKAAVYNFGSETNQWDALKIENQTTTGAYGLIIDSSHNFSVSSTFVTEAITAGTVTSTNENVFNTPVIINHSTDKTPIWLNGCTKFSIHQGYALSYATSAVTIDLTSISNPVEALEMDCHFEGASLTSIFLLTGASNRRITGFKYHDQQCTASTSVMKLNTGVTTIQLFGCDFNIRYFPNGTPTVFDTASQYNVEGVFDLPNAANWNTPSAFLGKVVTGSGFAEAMATNVVGTRLTINTATITSGTGAASGTQPAGSLYLRTDGSAGTHIYVSQGGGTWTAIGTV